MKVLFLRLIKAVPGLGDLQLYGHVERQMTGYFSPSMRHIYGEAIDREGDNTTGFFLDDNPALHISRTAPS